MKIIYQEVKDLGKRLNDPTNMTPVEPKHGAERKFRRISRLGLRAINRLMGNNLPLLSPAPMDAPFSTSKLFDDAICIFLAMTSAINWSIRE